MICHAGLDLAPMPCMFISARLVKSVSFLGTIYNRIFDLLKMQLHQWILTLI